MSTVAQIEESIRSLPTKKFHSLLGWMTRRHLDVLSNDGFETDKLETALLSTIDSPRRVVDENLCNRIRASSTTSD